MDDSIQLSKVARFPNPNCSRSHRTGLTFLVTIDWPLSHTYAVHVGSSGPRTPGGKRKNPARKSRVSCAIVDVSRFVYHIYSKPAVAP